MGYLSALSLHSPQMYNGIKLSPFRTVEVSRLLCMYTQFLMYSGSFYFHSFGLRLKKVPFHLKLSFLMLLLNHMYIFFIKKK